jgi:hypothetical protein
MYTYFLTMGITWTGLHNPQLNLSVNKNLIYT